MNQLFKKVVKKWLTKSHSIFRLGLYRLHGSLSDTVTIQTKQGRLTMSTRDDGIAQYLFRNKEYEYSSSVRAIQFLKSTGFVPSEDLCMLDIGANIGLISTGLLLANEIDYSIAIEPEPKNFALLEKNVAQNGLAQKTRCLQLAVGDQETTLTMELSPSNPGDHRIRSIPTDDATERLNESSRQTVQVQSRPLTQILQLAELSDDATPTPTLMWIDIQGYEGYAFEGGKELLGRKLPTVSEVWPYGIKRAGMSLEQYSSTVGSIWSDYWIERRNKFTRYPMSVFDRYLEELGNDGHFENVIFTNGEPSYAKKP